MILPVGMPVCVTRFKNTPDLRWLGRMDVTLNQVGLIIDGNREHCGRSVVGVRFGTSCWYYWPENVHPVSNLFPVLFP